MNTFRTPISDICGLRLCGDQCGFPMVPDFEQLGPKDTVWYFKFWLFVTTQDFQLVTQGKVLKNKIGFISEDEPYKAEDKFCY
ncbi:MAG: hypothetical protein ABSG22_09700 [Sedimentisphaerales bacterium]|jgi:hypothetical protein